jgi:hypothetical protein
MWRNQVARPAPSAIQLRRGLAQKQGIDREAGPRYGLSAGGEMGSNLRFRARSGIRSGSRISDNHRNGTPRLSHFRRR